MTIQCPICGATVPFEASVKEHQFGTAPCYGSHMPVFDYAQMTKIMGYQHEVGVLMYLVRKYPWD